MKFALALTLSAFSLSSFAQDSCEMRVAKLRERLDRVTAQLRACEASNPDRGELEYLRSENYRLTETNRLLQQRIDELEGRAEEKFFCAAGCMSASGYVDNRYLMSATGWTQLEADMLAKQEVQKKYSCNYGLKTYKCEMVRTEVQRNFCTVACVSASGTPDERYMAGSRGRNKVEAEFLAVKELQAKYSCNFGIGVIACN